MVYFPDCDIILYEKFFSRAESDRLYSILYNETLWQLDKIRLYGKMMALPRLTAWYGEPGKAYTYSGITMNPYPWTPTLLLIKQRIEAKADIEFSSVLLNLYRNGRDSVGWHSDDEKELGPNPVIGSASFGATRRFQMRHRTGKNLPKINIPLTHGSFLLMKDATQHNWEHQVPKTLRAVDPRINLTFRAIRECMPGYTTTTS